MQSILNICNDFRKNGYKMGCKPKHGRNNRFVKWAKHQMLEELAIGLKYYILLQNFFAISAILSIESSQGRWPFWRCWTSSNNDGDYISEPTTFSISLFSRSISFVFHPEHFLVITNIKILMNHSNQMSNIKLYWTEIVSRTTFKY